MQQQRRIAGLFQRRAECLHKLMRQFTDETDRVGEYRGMAKRQRQFAQRRIERREQAVGHMGIGLGQAPEQGRFARVGVANQCDLRGFGRLPRLTALLALTVHPFEALADLLDPTVDEPAVHLELRLARTAQSDPAFLALQMSPSAHEPRGQVGQLGEFHLQLAGERTCALGEDIEDQARAVEHATAERTLQVALLPRRQGMVHKHEVGFPGLQVLTDLFGLAGTDEELRIRFHPAADNLANDVGAAGECQFPEFLHRLFGPRTPNTDMDHDGPFGLAAGSLKQRAVSAEGQGPGRSTLGLAFVARCIQTDRARRHDR